MTKRLSRRELLRRRRVRYIQRTLGVGAMLAGQIESARTSLKTWPQFMRPHR